MQGVVHEKDEILRIREDAFTCNTEHSCTPTLMRHAEIIDKENLGMAFLGVSVINDTGCCRLRSPASKKFSSPLPGASPEPEEKLLVSKRLVKLRLRGRLGLLCTPAVL